MATKRSNRGGCFVSLLLVALAVGMMWPAWIYIGPGTAEGAEFTEALRSNKTADACNLALPELGPMIRSERTATTRPSLSNGIAALARGHGRRDYFHARATLTERCLQFEGRVRDDIRVVYVTMERRPEGWFVSDVSLDPTTTRICRGE